ACGATALAYWRIDGIATGGAEIRIRRGNSRAGCGNAEQKSTKQRHQKGNHELESRLVQGVGETLDARRQTLVKARAGVWLLRQAAFAGDAVVAEVVVDFVAVRALEASECLSFWQGVGALAFDEFAVGGRERLQAGFTFNEPDES